jgi:2-polyprenyl-3-methyl-5-hydroxy-6-metoxy-1,4-benzoquinol methylase
MSCALTVALLWVPMATGELNREVHTHGYSPRVPAYMAARTATREAGFLLPYLHAGMRVLDCGCGPGSITMDLARMVAPRQVEGINIGETQIASAEAGSLERGLTNVHFQVGTVYELPFPAGSFDVVFANTVTQHLSDPVRAQREMCRVLAWAVSLRYAMRTGAPRCSIQQLRRSSSGLRS